MNDLISRQALLEDLKARHDYVMADEAVSKKLKWYEAICNNAIVKTVNQQPTINPADLRPKGRWKKYVAVGEDMFGNKTEVTFACNCSVCGFDGRTDTNFCPNCGADMREEAE